MTERQRLIAEQAAARDAVSKAVLDACRAAGLRVVTGPSFTNMFVVEDEHGTKFNVLINRKRRQL